MSDDMVFELQRETGCDPKLGKLLLKFTGNDYNGALKILKSVDKDIIVVRGKFIGQSLKIYGAFIIIYNGKFKTIDENQIIIRFEDKSAIEFDFEKKWDAYLNDIIFYLKKNITEVARQEKFISLIKSQRTIFFLDSRFVQKKDINEDEINNFFTDLLSTVTGDVNIAVKLKFERTDIFEISKGNNIDLIEMDEEEHEEQSNEETGKKEQLSDRMLLLKIEPELAPVDGVSLSDLDKGDLVGVRIIDERPIAEYIAGLMQGRDLGSNELKTIFTPLKDIKVTQEGIYLSVEFGPGIYGQTYFGEDVKIKVANKSDDEEKQIEEKTNEQFFSKYFWFIAGSLLLIIIILFVLITY